MRPAWARLALVVLSATAIGSFALATRDDEATAGGGAEAALTGETRPTEMLFARRILMDAIGRNNDWLHDSVDGHFAWDAAEVRARLDAISAMLLTFPHLYHPNTNIWSEDAEAADAAAVSLSTDQVWAAFDAFYALAVAASETALQAAEARDRAETVRLIDALEVQCETCHEGYRQPRQSGREEFATDG